jgi:GDP-4-dehydro-6-deoxy-D-mannose reductase
MEPLRILVTGASGFVGRHLIGILRSEFPAATLIASGDAPMPEVDIELPLDLQSSDSIRECVAQAEPDVVIHLAAVAAVSGSFGDPMRTWRVNCDGSLLLAHALVDLWPKATLVFVSSAEIYGLTFQRGTALDEDAPLAPANPYAASKAAADIALGEFALRGLRLIRMRPVNHTGAGQSDMFVVPAFAKQVAQIEARKQPPVLRVGALDRWRDFLDVRDVCRAYVAAVRCASDIPPGAAINIASGTPRRIGDILNALISRADIEVEIQSEPSRLRPTDVETGACDAGRAHKLLHWSAETSWEDTLDNVLADWRVRVGKA